MLAKIKSTEVFRENCKLQFVLDQSGKIMSELYLHQKKDNCYSKKKKSDFFFQTHSLVHLHKNY